MSEFKKGEFALLEEQLVEIIDVSIRKPKNPPLYRYKIKLLNSNYCSWVNADQLKVLPSQKAVKVLFSS